MAGLPPQLNTTDPGTPSREWAKSTTTAAFARSDPAPNLSSAPTAPHHPDRDDAVLSDTNHDAGATTGFPGAYPDTPIGEQGPQEPTVRRGSVTETAQHIAGTASAFVQNAASTAAGYLPQGVVDVVSSYIRTITFFLRMRRISSSNSLNSCYFHYVLCPRFRA